MIDWTRIARAGALLAGIACAGQAWSFDSLADAYRSALGSDAAFRSAEAQYRSVLEKLPQARSGLLPQVSLNANRLKNSVFVSYASAFPNIDRQFRTDSWTVSITQPVFRLANILQYGRAQLQIEQAGVQLEAARYDLAFRMASAFFDWQTALRTRDASERARQRMVEVAGQARSGRRENLVTIPDLLDAEARLRQAEANAIEAAQALRIRSAALAKIVGTLPPDDLFSFSALPWPEVKGTVTDWVEQARNRNGQVRYQTLQVAMAEKDISAARAGHFPSIDLVANQNRLNNSGSPNLFDNGVASAQTVTVYGIQMTLPIYSGGFVNSRTDEAIALRDKAREDLNNAVAQAAIDAQTYFYQAEVGALQVDAAEKRVQAAESALAAAKSGRILQTQLDLDVLNAEALLLAAQRDLFRAKANRLVAVLQLRQASGELTDQDLETWSKLLVLAERGAAAR